MTKQPAVPEANAAYCQTCFGIFEGRTDCPADPVAECVPIYVSRQALGRSDDEDARLGRSNGYAYHVAQQKALRASTVGKARVKAGRA